MTTSTFAPFETIKVTCEVDWDLEDEDAPFHEPKCFVPKSVYTVELKAEQLILSCIMQVDAKTGDYVIDNDALENSDYLSDALTDDAGFCHKGYNVLRIDADAD